MDERKRDWELNTLRSQAGSLDPQRRMGVEQTIGELERRRNNPNFSESDFTQRTRMDWDVQRAKSDIWQKENEQRQEEQLRFQEQQRRAQEQINRQQIGVVSASSALPPAARRPKQRRDPGPLTSSEIIRLRMGFGASDLASPEERERIAYHQRSVEQRESIASHQQQTEDARALLDYLVPRMNKENAELADLIPRAQFASDITRLLSRYPYGFLHQDAQQARERKSQQLLSSGMVLRDGEDFDEIRAMEERGIKTMNELLEKATKAEASLR